MIKKVKLLKTLTDKFELPVDVFEVKPPFQSEQHPLEAEFLTGGFYRVGYPMIALYVSDSEGNILDTQPIIMEEGFAKYQQLFKHLGYTLV